MNAHRLMKLRVLVLVLILLAIISLPVGAQEAAVIGEPTPVPAAADYPTVAALDAAVIPQRDRVALAQALQGIGKIPPPPTSAPPHAIGDRQTFWASNLSSNGSVFQVDATLQAAGQYIYLWVQDGTTIDSGRLQRLVDEFDNVLYPREHQLWGSESSPGIDGDRHVYGLFVHGLGGSTAAYYAGDHSYPSQVDATSNQHEMFFFNLDAIPPEAVDSQDMFSIIAHEFQHMIRANVDPNEDTWMDEGFSMFTERYLGFDGPLGAAASFMQNPQTQLDSWTEVGDRAPNYGAAMLFIDYFYERYGLDAIQALSQDQANGLRSMDEVLAGMGQPGVDDLFADWVVANYLQDSAADDGRYGYRLIPVDIRRPAIYDQVSAYPYQTTAQNNQYAAQYYLLPVTNRSALDIHLNVADTVPLIPASVPDGHWMWYSNRGDNSDMTLTRSFDLSGVQHATLHFKVWYYTENAWDYGYVMASRDGGQTWTPLETAHTTRDNPYNKAFGPGYTGQSNGWLDETASLDAYAGSQVLLRFETITDDAINQPGMAVDDVQIPEIGYSDGFESGDGGWEAAGWIRTDNRLPQEVWVQAIQMHGQDFTVTRWKAPQENTWTLNLAAGTDQVILVVSPFAPVTTVPATYSLDIAAQ